MSPKPRVIELEEEAVQSSYEVEPIKSEDLPVPLAVRAMAKAKPSFWGGLFWVSLTTLLGLMITMGIWNFVEGLLAISPTLSLIATALVGVLILALLVLCLRELQAFGRLRRIDRLRQTFERDWSDTDVSAADAAIHDVTRLYRGRDEMRWAEDRFKDLSDQALTAPDRIAVAETVVMAPLDKNVAEIMRASARRVTTITALVPLALADVVGTLWINIRMIRQIALVYGGRSGTLGSYRLFRAVVSHLVATGAIALTDDLITSVAGGGLASKISRRFGEGIVNGALTLRVGIAAMEVCRPMPFVHLEKPKVRTELKAAVSGLFQKG